MKYKSCKLFSILLATALLIGYGLTIADHSKGIAEVPVLSQSNNNHDDNKFSQQCEEDLIGVLDD